MKKKNIHTAYFPFFLFFLLHGLTTVFRNIGCIIGENFICCADSFFFFFSFFAPVIPPPEQPHKKKKDLNFFFFLIIIFYLFTIFSLLFFLLLLFHSIIISPFTHNVFLHSPKDCHPLCLQQDRSSGPRQGSCR